MGRQLLAAYTRRQSPEAGESAISDKTTLAALVSIVTSLWIGVAFMLAVRAARRLPAASSEALRVAFGVLTFFLWYLAMLSAMGVLALLTVRKFRDVGLTVGGLLALTAVVGLVRRAVRPVPPRSAPAQPPLAAEERR
ncbi:MAG: hypothetical protein ACLPJH_18015 [Myxococcaceae bacterium]